MIDYSLDEFWWENITGPHVLATKVSEALLDDRMVVLAIPPDVPWLDAMRSAIQTAFQRKLYDIHPLFHEIDITEDELAETDPGKFLLNRFGTEMARLSYREKMPIQDYIVQKKMLNNTIVWVKGLNDNGVIEQWTRFCRGFKNRAKQDGLFILEMSDQIRQIDMKPLEVIKYSDCVSNYDVQLFNRIVLGDQGKYSDTWKNYIASVSASVCDTDAELSAALIETMDFKRKSILDGIKTIAESEGEVYSEHAQWYLQNRKTDEIEHRIWRAQVQVLFPVIELERLDLIQKWNYEIQKTLNDKFVFQFREHIQDVSQVELGTLDYIVNKYEYCIRDEKVCKWISFLHECRNQLAHAECCTPDQVRQLLDRS